MGRRLHRSISRALVASALGAVMAAAPAAPAAAAEDASIAHIESRKGELRLLVSVPPDAEVDLAGVEVSVDGVVADAEAERAGSGGTVRRTAVLAIDTSNSMRGARFDAAQAAAETFLTTVPADVEVGIVSFAAEVTQELSPTTDRAAAAEVIENLTLSSQTRLYDGVLSAVEMAGTEGQRTLLVLSDGADTSDTALQDVTEAVEGSEVLVDVVALQQTGRAKAALTVLANAGDGQVIDSDPASLSRAFNREAAILARQVLVTAQVPAAVQDKPEAPVVVSLPSRTGVLVAEAFAPIRRAADADEVAPPVPEVDRGLVLDRTWLYVGLGGLGLGLVALVVLLARREGRELSPAERAAAYTDAVAGRGGAAVGNAGQPPRFEPDHALDQAKDAAQKVLARNRSLEARIAKRLEGAGNPLKPAEWLLLHAAIFVGAGLLGLLLGGGGVVLTVLFLAVGGFGPYVWLHLARSRRRKAFNSALPETLQLMSGSLAAGLSLAQSVDTIVREGVEPVASEFRRVLVETRLGVSLEDALDGVAGRFDSKDFSWVVMAIKIQRQVGGNLGELLDNVAATIREREYMRRQVAALAAEGKLSAWVLGGLPPAFLLYLLVTNHDYVIVMFQDPVGWLMLGIAGLLLSLGVFWMSRLIKVEV